MTCKECIHYQVCGDVVETFITAFLSNKGVEDICKNFKQTITHKDLADLLERAIRYADGKCGYPKEGQFCECMADFILASWEGVTRNERSTKESKEEILPKENDSVDD